MRLVKERLRSQAAKMSKSFSRLYDAFIAKHIEKFRKCLDGLVKDFCQIGAIRCMYIATCSYDKL